MASLGNLVVTILRLAEASNIAAALRHHARRPGRPLQTIMTCRSAWPGPELAGRIALPENFLAGCQSVALLFVIPVLPRSGGGTGTGR